MERARVHLHPPTLLVHAFGWVKEEGSGNRVHRVERRLRGTPDPTRLELTVFAPSHRCSTASLLSFAFRPMLLEIEVAGTGSTNRWIVWRDPQSRFWKLMGSEHPTLGESGR